MLGRDYVYYKNNLLIDMRDTEEKRDYRVYIHLEMFNIEGLDYATLLPVKSVDISLTGDIYTRWGYRGRFGLEAFGQIYDHLKHLLEKPSVVIKSSIDKKTILRLIELWEKWYFNSIVRGTKEQLELLERLNIQDYNKAVKILKKHNLYVVKKNGRTVTYDKDILIKPVPQEVIDELIKIFEVPTGQNN